MRFTTMFLVLSFLAGCGYENPGKQGEPLEITGRVTKGGKAVTDVVLNFQATGEGRQASMPLKNGEFKGSMTPGKYTYFFSEMDGKSKAFVGIPEKYRQGSLDRQIEIGQIKTLDLTLD